MVHPCGRALRRIQYFESQRALDTVRAKHGRVVPQAIDYGRERNGQTRGLEAFRASHAVGKLPRWRPVGPISIPKGQSYTRGEKHRPPVSGRCVGIVISATHPNRLILCTAGGGIWGSRDQGKNWRPLTDDQPTLSMGAIAAAPSSPNIVYAGTGEGDTSSPFGVGVLRSVDGGWTWKHEHSSALAGTSIYDIAVDPRNEHHLWVGTTTALLESRDGGKTCRTVQPFSTWNVSIHPLNPAEVFAATAAGVIRSINGGKTWQQVLLLGSPDPVRFRRVEVCHAPSDPGVVYIAAGLKTLGMLWRRSSVDGVFTKEIAAPLNPWSDLAQAWYDWCFAVSPEDADVIYWGAVELYRGKRVARGWSWRNISSRQAGISIHPDQHHVVCDPSNSNVIYACNDGGVYRSPNRGKTWKSLNRGLCIAEFEFIVQLESKDDWLLGGTQDNGTLTKARNGAFRQVAFGDGGDCGADDVNGLCYHSFNGMSIERARATGRNAFNWIDVSPPAPDRYRALFYPPMDVVGSTVAKAGVTLFVSQDCGHTWIEVEFGRGKSRASAVSIFDEYTIFVGTEDGKVVRIERGVGGWTRSRARRLVSPRKGFVSDIVVPGAPDEIVWVSCSALKGGHIFRSTNGGKTWKNRTGNLPDIAVNAIVVDPKNPDRIFAATDHGVYRTENAGASWTNFSRGLPNAIVGDMIFHARRRLLRVGTRNRGVWQVRI